jgi:hypothetical protein
MPFISVGYLQHFPPQHPLSCEPQAHLQGPVLHVRHVLHARHKLMSICARLRLSPATGVLSAARSLAQTAAPQWAKCTMHSARSATIQAQHAREGAIGRLCRAAGLHPTAGAPQQAPHSRRFTVTCCAGAVSLQFGFRGPNLCAATACASGAHAIGDALHLLRTRTCSAVLAGAPHTCAAVLLVRLAWCT